MTGRPRRSTAAASASASVVLPAESGPSTPTRNRMTALYGDDRLRQPSDERWLRKSDVRLRHAHSFCHRNGTCDHSVPPSVVRQNTFVWLPRTWTSAAPTAALLKSTDWISVAARGVFAAVHVLPPSVVRSRRAPAPLPNSTATRSEAGAISAEFASAGVFSRAKLTPPSIERHAPASSPVGQTAQITFGDPGANSPPSPG